MNKIVLNEVKDNKGDIIESDNVYRARELILKRVEELFRIVKKAQVLKGKAKGAYCLKQAKRIVSEEKYPNEWVDTLTKGFEKGVMVRMYPENLDLKYDEEKSEIRLIINAYTKLRDVEDIWKKEVLILQEILKSKTHKPKKITNRDFVFAFYKKYKDKDEYDDMVKLFVKRANENEYSDPDKPLSENTIIKGVSNTMKKIKQ